MHNFVAESGLKVYSLVSVVRQTFPLVLNSTPKTCYGEIMSKFLFLDAGIRLDDFTLKKNRNNGELFELDL